MGKHEHQAFFENSVTYKLIRSGIALVVAIVLAAALKWVAKALFETDTIVLPALVWMGWAYAQTRIIFERHTRAALAIAAAGTLLLVCLSSFVIEYDPVGDVDQAASARNLGPMLGHPLGTDFVGRDMVMLLVKGTEGFFLPGLLAAFIAVVFGVSLGAIAGYLGGRVDKVITFFTTLVGSFPRLVFILLACTIAEEPDMLYIGGLVGVLFVPQMAQAIRRRVLALKEEDFIIASQAHGVGMARILFYHIVWLQCFPEIVRQGLYLFVYVIFVETALSYLELETMSFEASSWGKMLNDAKDAMATKGSYWHALVPTVAIVFATLGATALGDVIVGSAKEERL